MLLCYAWVWNCPSLTPSPHASTGSRTRHATLQLKLQFICSATFLAGEQQDLRCAAGCITRLQLSHDDGMLVAAAADGCLLVFDVRDRDVTRLGKGCGGAEPRPQPTVSMHTPECLGLTLLAFPEHPSATR